MKGACTHVNKISIKLAMYFFAVVLVLEFMMMFYLHQNIIHNWIDEEYTRLLANGANHRDVLIENYSDTTIQHIVMMENNIDREVIIINRNGNVINSSDYDNIVLESYIPLVLKQLSKVDRIVVSDYENSPYIISAHPYQNGHQSGYLIMYKSTNSINKMVSDLTRHFEITGAASVLILLIVYAVLSRVLTRPLIRMKEATEKLGNGNFNVTLPINSNDELGELSFSIQKLATNLEQLKTERNEFLASISHELSTPLTYLIGYSKVALREGLDSQERERYLTIIEEEAERMKSLVKNLLELAKIDENSFTVSKSYFFSKSFLNTIYELVEPSFHIKNLTLNLQCKDNFQVYADSLRLQQIVLNLLDNAMKYSNEYTEIYLEMQKIDDKTVISVKDEGIGIPSEEIEYIFDRLYRVEKSRSRASGGSGIGLAIVKELVDAHGGTIEVTSKLGEGSSFKVTI